MCIWNGGGNVKEVTSGLNDRVSPYNPLGLFGIHSVNVYFCIYVAMLLVML